MFVIDLSPGRYTLVSKLKEGGERELSLVRDDIYALRKSHMRSVPSHRSFPDVAMPYETFAMLKGGSYTSISRKPSQNQNDIYIFVIW